ncbi:integrase catalytic domain-containing protein [Trichonephila clavipes]|nr:integrase catalytic domain-containing protein [Trichonephila clavipes]
MTSRWDHWAPKGHGPALVTSVENKEELKRFIQESATLMSRGRFELREWEYSGQCRSKEKVETHVLGLLWNKESDTLKIDISWMNDVDTGKITKRNILSIVHKMFDPFGFISPVMLCPKLTLQKARKKGIRWDEDIKCELRKEFLLWFHELTFLKDLEVPRYVQVTEENLSIHTFVDGSQDAYAAVVFLRIEKEDRTEVFFLTSKARISSLRGATIPRMELLAAVIGTRLTNSVIKALQWENIKKYYWSDSTTVLAWIRRDDNWTVFVRNRVNEIRKLSDPTSWRHVPGEKNSADLTSRGCKAKQFLSSRWWEGPKWMKDPFEFKHLTHIVNSSYDEDEIEKEKYESIVRLIAWILRFKHNCVRPKEKRHGELVTSEFQEAEEKLISLIQNECFSSESDDRLKALQAFRDEKGIL